MDKLTYDIHIDNVTNTFSPSTLLVVSYDGALTFSIVPRDDVIISRIELVSLSEPHTQIVRIGTTALTTNHTTQTISLQREIYISDKFHVTIEKLSESRLIGLKDLRLFGTRLGPKRPSSVPRPPLNKRTNALLAELESLPQNEQIKYFIDKLRTHPHETDTIANEVVKQIGTLAWWDDSFKIHEKNCDKQELFEPMRTDMNSLERLMLSAEIPDHRQSLSVGQALTKLLNQKEMRPGTLRWMSELYDEGGEVKNIIEKFCAFELTQVACSDAESCAGALAILDKFGDRTKALVIVKDLVERVNFPIEGLNKHVIGDGDGDLRLSAEILAIHANKFHEIT